MMQQRAGDIKHSLSDYDSGWVGQIWCILQVPNFSPLTYNGEVTKLTWPKVTDIKNPKYTNCRHLCPYCTLRVSKSSDHWCAFGTMSNFEKRNLRSGHLMWPGGVTFGVIGSSFFRNVSNCWLNSYGKFGGATRRRFFAICEKPERGGGWYPPPPRPCAGYMYIGCVSQAGETWPYFRMSANTKINMPDTFKHIFQVTFFVLYTSGRWNHHWPRSPSPTSCRTGCRHEWGTFHVTLYLSRNEWLSSELGLRCEVSC